MKYIVLGLFAVAVTYSPAEAKGGKFPDQPHAYEYKRESKKDYKKDFCLDSVGNHIYCQDAKAAE